MDRFRNFTPSVEEREILDRYPVSGVYRVGASPELLWELGYWYDPPIVHSFFSSGDDVHLVLGSPGGLLFYRNGELLKEVDRSQIFSAPWRAGESACGGPGNLEVQASSVGREPEIVVKTEEGSRLVFAARTGALISARRPISRAAVDPSAEEEELAALVSDFSKLAKSRQLASLAYEWMRLFEAMSLHDCMPVRNDPVEIAEVVGRQIDPDDYGAVWLVPWRAEQPVNADVRGLTRVRISQGAPFAMFRVPEGEAVATLCGIEPLPTRLLAARLGSPYPQRQEDYEPLAEALNGPTVLVASAGVWEGDGAEEVIGMASLWRRASGEWRNVGFQLFAWPPDEDEDQE